MDHDRLLVPVRNGCVSILGSNVTDGAEIGLLAVLPVDCHLVRRKIARKRQNHLDVRTGVAAWIPALVVA
jgi:hypothetical protein